MNCWDILQSVGHTIFALFSDHVHQTDKASSGVASIIVSDDGTAEQ